VAARAEGIAAQVLGAGELERVSRSLHDLRRLLEDAPKSTRWKLRARVGERLPWYESPEDIEHG
jgi:hypothetical protein